MKQLEVFMRDFHPYQVIPLNYK